MGNFGGLPQQYAGGVSVNWTTPYPHALGSVAVNGGEIYILCQTGANTTVAPEMAVVIGSDFTVTPVTSGAARGPVGVVADLGKLGNTSAPVSAYPINTSVWVQVYGRAFVQVGTNASSPSDAANGPTTVGTSAQITFVLPTSATTPVGVLGLVTGITTAAHTTGALIIRGMTVATDVSLGDVSAVTAVSATHIGARAAVYLNFPEIVVSTDTVS